MTPSSPLTPSIHSHRSKCGNVDTLIPTRLPLHWLCCAAVLRALVCTMSSVDSSEAEAEEEHYFTIPSIEQLAESLDDEQAPIAKRMRTCFLLKQLHTPEAIEVLSRGLQSASILLGHECAYVMGQMTDRLALPYLTAALCDDKQHPIVRHECAEALAAIDADESLPVLERYCDDANSEVAETCLIAAHKMREARQQHTDSAVADCDTAESVSKYASVDPAPPLSSRSVPSLLSTLTDCSLSMYERYRAMFTLRNLGTEDAIAALCESLSSSQSPVFRHEVCYVLGQMQHPAGLPTLRALLADRSEHAMVRHEAAEAIGSIAEDDSKAVLGSYATDAAEDVIVKESVLVALDLAEYWNSDEVSTALDDGQQQHEQQQRLEGQMSIADAHSRRRNLTDDIAVTRA